MDNRIYLKFDKSATRLAGNPYGREVFREQAKDFIDYDSKNHIIIPDNIQRIASSFTQGFFAEIIDRIGYEGIEEKIVIETSNEELKKDIYEDLIS